MCRAISAEAARLAHGAGAPAVCRTCASFGSVGTGLSKFTAINSPPVKAEGLNSVIPSFQRECGDDLPNRGVYCRAGRIY